MGFAAAGSRTCFRVSFWGRFKRQREFMEQTEIAGSFVLEVPDLSEDLPLGVWLGNLMNIHMLPAAWARGEPTAPVLNQSACEGESISHSLQEGEKGYY